jgi:hypothetical protein
MSRLPMPGTITFYLLLFFLGCNSKPASNSPSGPSGNVSPQSAMPTRANLQLVLEGPMAICLRPEKYPGKIQVLIPKAKGHFEPGFDADRNETILCNGEYSLDFGETNSRSTVPPELVEQGETRWEKMRADCSQKKPGYLSILLEKPDQILPFRETRATISVDNSGSATESSYVTQTLFYYKNVLRDGLSVNRHSDAKCKVTVKLPGGIKVKRKYKFPQPWKPQFYSLGSDIRLTVGMTPSELDDTMHHHAARAHDEVASMLGVHRTISFPRLSKHAFGLLISPHNDCRAPQIMVQPLEAEQKP